ncbi:MAG: hypothetical protein ACRDRW_20000, partial [Pseudonocardiaceae bacterium]
AVPWRHALRGQFRPAQRQLAPAPVLLGQSRVGHQQMHTARLQVPSARGIDHSVTVPRHVYSAPHCPVPAPAGRVADLWPSGDQ